jgi:hypothetical protein
MDPDDASSAEMRRRRADRDADPPALDEETVERLLTGELDAAHAPPGYADMAELRAVTRARAVTRPAAKPVRRRRVGLPLASSSASSPPVGRPPRPPAISRNRYGRRAGRS